MTAEQKHDIIPVCTTVLSADQQLKEDIMLDQQKITILYCRLSNEAAQEGESNSIANLLKSQALIKRKVIGRKRV